ncbi:MAG: hypothetical protein ACKO2L_16240, partial [Planctomycetaceae bacterium]
AAAMRLLRAVGGQPPALLRTEGASAVEGAAVLPYMGPTVVTSTTDFQSVEPPHLREDCTVPRRSPPKNCRRLTAQTSVR